MVQDIVEALKKQGFTKYEARTYLALVRLGKSTAREIGESAGVPQGRVYTVLNNLASRGFVNVQEGSPAIYCAPDPAEIFTAIKDDYCDAVNELIRQLREQRSRASAPAAPFWTISSERGIQIIVKAALRNAHQEVIILAGDPRHIRPFVPALKTAARGISLFILAENKSVFAGLGLQVRTMGRDLLALLEEMHHGGAVMHYDTIAGECFLLIDRTLAISIGYREGKMNATVIRMSTLCFMMRKLIGIAEPEIGPMQHG
ncbi:helix-turn-helix domain-containing protein [Methanoregula sp.]|uniref:TrmB family transcriptional regulator n=1 Tax=Methanoregula sp. TaxID=2052170 RepID=UPI002639DD58|nr:helix-turn-helix domain-containing protein [Methanoregula sp.]MDD5144335.1 helix-turn-helix domain-containing protein [Methanoregula sp.]